MSHVCQNCGRPTSSPTSTEPDGDFVTEAKYRPAVEKLGEWLAAPVNVDCFFELARATAIARTEISKGSPTTTAGRVAIARVLRALRAVVAWHEGLLNKSMPHHRADALRMTLDIAIFRAIRIVDERQKGPALDAIKDLALYAGDHHPDSSATANVMDRAKEVFVRVLEGR